MFHQSNENNRKFKTRMERHEVEGEDEAETDDHQTKKYIPARKLSKEETETLALEKQERKEEEKEGKKEKAPFTFKLRHAIVSIGTVFVLALIAYTTILYGGKLFVDQDKLLITPPTTVETEDGEILWYLYDEYRLPVDLEDIPDHVKDAFVTVEDKRFYS